MDTNDKGDVWSDARGCCLYLEHISPFDSKGQAAKQRLWGDINAHVVACLTGSFVI